jgi:pilus assembly protein Flp/PilA
MPGKCAPLNWPAQGRLRDFRVLAKNDSGSTAIEYGLIAAGIAIGITMAVSSLGSHVKSTISNLADMASSSSKAGSAASTQSTSGSETKKR